MSGADGITVANMPIRNFLFTGPLSMPGATPHGSDDAAPTPIRDL